MNTVIVAENPLEVETWESFEAEDVCAFLKDYFEVWPDTARIYHEQVSEANDVTPSDEGTIDRLRSLEGTFYVVVYPGDPTTIIIAILAVAAAAAASFLLMPAAAMPTISAQRNVRQSSPNNELSNRTNKARLLERISDIFGTVISIPDLIALPYKKFENNVEVEYAYMCVGRGAYEITDIKDDATLVSSIEGTKVEVYAPFTSPNSGDEPQIRIGEAINTPILNAARSNAVNGQLLKSPNSNTIIGDANIRAFPDGVLQIQTDTGVDFREYFKVGETLNIANLAPVDGNYTIISVSQYEVKVIISGPGWVTIVGSTPYMSADLTVFAEHWVGPFVMDGPDVTKIMNNFVAQNGLYEDTGINQYPATVNIRIGITPVDEDDVPLTAELLTDATIRGSAVSRETKAVTVETALPGNYVGRCLVRARRLTDSNYVQEGTIVDDIKWRDLYSLTPVNISDFGDVTTVQAVTVATSGALNIKDRKLNLTATRKVPTRTTGSNFTEAMYPTSRADEILSFVLMDPKIGNRKKEEIDFDNIYETVAEIVEYFGTDVAADFNYTFDNTNISLEETVANIVSAIFCVAYRRGNVIKISFEKQTEDSMLLFNHRNKLPDTEQRTVRFGNQDDNDGVELEYISTFDGALLNYYIPTDRSAVNPKTIKTIGVSGRLKAYFHAWRAWNKIRFQNTVVDFEATQEADLLVLRDRILVTDNTRSKSYDGQVEEQNGLELVLSQAIDFDMPGPYTIFLQHVDGTVEALPVSAGSDPYRVILGAPPKAAIAVDPELYAQATFAIVGNAGRKTMPFLLSEKEPKTNFTIGVNAINYDDRYYANDTDFKSGLVNQSGN